jgi:hypothetical protein
MSKFEIVVGTSTKSPDDAAKKAEAKARKAGGEQVSIAACVLSSGGTSPVSQAEMSVLENMAKNIYQLVQCTCPTVVGEKIVKPGTPPPFTSTFPARPVPASVEWVVYILLKR